MGALMQDDEPMALELVKIIKAGETGKLRILLEKNTGLAGAEIVTEQPKSKGIRSLLHIATDWPGRIPNGPEVIRILVQAGADVNARFNGGHSETPLHFAASTNDVPVLDALLDAGAELEAEGSVIGGGSALSNAVAFGQWDAARCLVQRGARMLLWHAAALGEMSTVRRLVEQEGANSRQELAQALWLACHGGQRDSVEYLIGRGTELNWIGYDGLTPLDAASRSGAYELADWLSANGAKRVTEL